MPTELSETSASDYHQWLTDLKTRFRQVQIKAAVAVNTALLQFYWELGADIVAQQARNCEACCFAIVRQSLGALCGHSQQVPKPAATLPTKE